MSTILPGLAAVVDERTIVLSIAAGTTIAQLRAGTGGKRIVRTMPNTPAAIGAGMTAWTATASVSADQRAFKYGCEVARFVPGTTPK